MIAPVTFQKDLLRFDDVTPGQNLAYKKKLKEKTLE